jgi:hypothetical protein
VTRHLKQQAMRANAIIFLKKIGASRQNATKNKIRAHSCGHAQKVTQPNNRACGASERVLLHHRYLDGDQRKKRSPGRTGQCAHREISC